MLFSLFFSRASLLNKSHLKGVFPAFRKLSTNDAKKKKGKKAKLSDKQGNQQIAGLKEVDRKGMKGWKCPHSPRTVEILLKLDLNRISRCTGDDSCALPALPTVNVGESGIIDDTPQSWRPDNTFACS